MLIDTSDNNARLFKIVNFNKNWLKFILLINAKLFFEFIWEMVSYIRFHDRRVSKGGEKREDSPLPDLDKCIFSKTENIHIYAML